MNTNTHPNVRFLDCEKAGQIASYLTLHADLIAECRKHGATLDLATSDVVLYVEDCNTEMKAYLFSRWPDGVMVDATTFCA